MSLENIKIKSCSEEEANEIILLAKILGYERLYNNFTLVNGWVCLDSDDDELNVLCVAEYQADNSLDKYKEITIQELLDMAVLKRNDVGDANFIRPRDGKLYFKSSANRYYHMLDDEWIMSTWENEQLEPQLKPIKEKQANETEYLLQGKNGDYLLESIEQMKEDNVNHPSHYCSHPSGIECIEITRHHDFAIGNAIKYLWRAGLKDSDNEVQDLEKAIFYIKDKIKQLESKVVDDKTIDWIDEGNK